MALCQSFRCLRATSYKHNINLAECALSRIIVRNMASQRETFKFSDLSIQLDHTANSVTPDFDNLVFGRTFSSHMLQIEWTKEGWDKPRISPLKNLSLHPAAKVFHYAQELFEGMKAFRSVKDEVVLFRPDMNISRLLSSAQRACLPLFDGEEFLKCIMKLVDVDKHWVPTKKSCSLYIRPTFIGIEPALGVASASQALLYVITGPVGPYFATGIREPVSLYATPAYVRAWSGGIGDKKMGANYAPTLYVQQEAQKLGFQQVLWLYGDDHQITEVGTMNVFIYLINDEGQKELITPPLDGIILPGVVRQSLLELAREWNEFKVTERVITMKELITALNEKRILEVFGSGTACVVCPVSSITFKGQKLNIPTAESKDALNDRFYQVLSDIQVCKIPSRWTVKVN